MQEISAYTLIKEKLQAIPNLRHKGSLFEKLFPQKRKTKSPYAIRKSRALTKQKR
ncbi:hypothetical protein [Helicobacter pylori]|uniref:hypothetical protein n=1 Tax=Helicobacter pylori TaxID=210 RepID=UPI003562C254